MVSILPLISRLLCLFVDHSKGTKHNWYHLHLSTTFQLFCKIQMLVYLFAFFYFQSISSRMAKSIRWQVLFFLLINSRSSLLAGIGWSVFISRPWEFYYCYHHLLLLEFFTPVLVDGFSQEFEWQQVSRTLFSILVNFNNAVVWMVSTHPFIF